LPLVQTYYKRLVPGDLVPLLGVVPERTGVGINIPCRSTRVLSIGMTPWLLYGGRILLEVPRAVRSFSVLSYPALGGWQH